MKSVMHGRSLATVCAAWVVCALPVRAQVGFAFIPVAFDRLTNVEVPMKYQFGLALDFDTGPRTGLGFDFTIDPGLITTNALYAPIETSEIDGNTTRYQYSSSTFAVQLKSMFFFTDNDKAAPYMAVCAGVRNYSIELTRDTDNDYNDYNAVVYPFPNKLKASRMVFPVGLRFGVRGDLPKAFADVNFRMGYLIGGGELLFTEPYTLTRSSTFGSSAELKMTRLTIGFGCSFGFGGGGKKKPEGE